MLAIAATLDSERPKDSSVKRRRAISSDDVLHVVNGIFSLPHIFCCEEYLRRGEQGNDGVLRIQLGPDCDWRGMTTDEPIVFKAPENGGNSPRVRNAIALLALAIKLDNEERPDSPG